MYRHASACRHTVRKDLLTELSLYASRTVSPRNMPEAFWLRPVMAATASVQPESCRIVYAGSDFPHLIRFGSSEEGLGYTVQNRPGSICKTWSSFGRMHFDQYELCVLRLPVVLCAGFCRAGNNVLTALQVRLQRYPTLPLSRASCSRLKGQRHCLRAQSQGHHTIDGLEERGVERGSA